MNLQNYDSQLQWRAICNFGLKIKWVYATLQVAFEPLRVASNHVKL